SASSQCTSTDVPTHTTLLSAIPTFFFQCHADPRDLHSFPTRRSSDLLLHAVTRHLLHADAQAGGVARVCIEGQQVVVDDDVVGRSEEHTSELQSPYDLVCRLLLEKKNLIVGFVMRHLHRTRNEDSTLR